MPRARVLTFRGIHEARGRCPWRIDFGIDDLLWSAFFRPPEQISHQIDEHDIRALATTVLIDLVADVRPHMIRADAGAAPAPCGRLFRDACCALLAEHDAMWNRPRWTALPTWRGGRINGVPSRHRNKLAANRVVLGFSGGKDSIASLFALIEAGYDVVPVMLNQGDRDWQDLRRWAPRLRALGCEPMIAYLSASRRAPLHQRYGDTYYSSYQMGWLVAVLALCAQATNARVITLGIESSADHTSSVVRDRRINHQHQKTARHLGILQTFVQRVVNPQLQVASPLSSFTDSQVLRYLLTDVPPRYQAFSSCGGANASSKHCGQCDKCAFIFALLYESPQGRRLARRIFRSNLLNDVELYRPWLDARCRAPLACVGPRDEVWSVFEQLADTDLDLPVIRRWRTAEVRRRYLAAPEVRLNGVAAPALDHPVRRAAAVIRRTLDSTEGVSLWKAARRSEVVGHAE